MKSKWEKEKEYKSFEKISDYTFRQQLEERNKPEIIDRVIKYKQNIAKQNLILICVFYAIIVGGMFAGLWFIDKNNDDWEDARDNWVEKNNLLSEELCKEKELGNKLINYKSNGKHIIECEKGNIILGGEKK